MDTCPQNKTSKQKQCLLGEEMASVLIKKSSVLNAEMQRIPNSSPSKSTSGFTTPY